MKNLKASDKQITYGRRRLQNPYAYQTDTGSFEAEVMPWSQQVELEARNLHVNIWKARKELFPEGVPADPVRLLDPSLAIRYIGYEYDLADDLGNIGAEGSSSEIAGVIDRFARRISISRKLPSNTHRFTAAHELGHAILHKGARMHRDRPIDGSKKSHGSRSKMEREADQFAVCFLMPEKLVRDRFKMLFGGRVFVLTDDTAFALDSSSPEALMNRCKTIRDLSKILAKIERYNGRQFCSLASQFGVSVETMVIRIGELGLVEMYRAR